MIEAVVVFLFILVFLLFIYGLAHLLVSMSQVVYNLSEKDNFEKLKRTVEERIRLKREAEEAQLREEQESLRIKAEKAEAERIRTQSQIWVIG